MIAEYSSLNPAVSVFCQENTPQYLNIICTCLCFRLTMRRKWGGSPITTVTQALLIALLATSKNDSQHIAAKAFLWISAHLPVSPDGKQRWSQRWSMHTYVMLGHSRLEKVKIITFMEQVIRQRIPLNSCTPYKCGGIFRNLPHKGIIPAYVYYS